MKSERHLGCYLLLTQGLYYLLTGVWPLINIVNFQRVTGPKNDLWLVQTVGLLVTVVGAVLLSAGLRRQKTLEVGLLAIGCSAGLLTIDLIYVSGGVLSKVYLLDAAAQFALAVGYVASFRLSRRTGSPEKFYERESVRA